MITRQGYWREAMAHSNDPMILNIIGKNYQALGAYEKAEEYLIRSTHRLPGRIYPYYLLVKLYTKPEYQQPEKLKWAVEVSADKRAEGAIDSDKGNERGSKIIKRKSRI